MKRIFAILVIAAICSLFIFGQLLAIAISPEKSKVDAAKDADATQTELTNNPPPPPVDDGIIRNPGEIVGDTTPPLPVPEPGTLILIGSGLIGLATAKKFKK